MRRNVTKSMIQFVGRVYLILKCFEENIFLRITEISKIFYLHKSSASRLVNSLKAPRLLEQDAEMGMYKLGLELFKLGVYVNINITSVASKLTKNAVRKIKLYSKQTTDKI